MTSPCSSAVLESALARNLPPGDEDALQRHLDECEACSAALERMAGGSAWCQEAASLLAEDEWDAALPPHDEWSAVDFTVEHLEPADEPNVLGRLGGYDVLEIIGHGGMGVVLKAFDRELKRCVAIKVLAPHLAQSSLAKKRFAREAQAAAAIVHPHVLAIHHVQPNGPLPFLVMPLVAGDSLAERLTARGTLELTETLRIGMQAAAGLAAAHEQGLVHRDVKPANILLEKGIDRAVLTDFGLARAADDVTLTRWGIIAGTPQYMSPEQARGEALDGRSDLFSLGCVLYEMATGVSPFRTDSILATMRRLVDETPRAMAALNPELPPWFIGIVDRLLEKDPSRRLGSAKEVSELLEQCLAHVQQPAVVPLPAGVPVSKSISHAAPAAQRRRTNRFVGGIVVLLVIGFGGFAAFLMATAEPCDISGEWTADDWGKVVLKQTAPAEYAGTYTDVFGKEPGKIELKWSRIERRYNGTWSEGKDRLGKISVRPLGDEIRGAWTTNRKSDINPGTPALADLLWVRPNTRVSSNAPSPNLTFGPVMERTLNDISVGPHSILNLESGELLSPPEDVREFDKAQIWMQSNDADVVACWDGGGRGLRIVGGLAIHSADARWDATPKNVAEAVIDMERQLADYKKTMPELQGPLEMGFSNLWADGKDKPIFYIKTRYGTIGTLQIVRMSDKPGGVEIRYKMLGKKHDDPDTTIPTQKSWHPSPPPPPSGFPSGVVIPSPYAAHGSEPIVPWDLAQQVKVGQTKAQVIELFRKRGHSAPADEDAQGRYLLFATNNEKGWEVALRIDAERRVADISYKEINLYDFGATGPPNDDRLQLAGTKATKQLLASLENDDAAGALSALQKILDLEPDIIAQLRGDDAHEALIKLAFQQLKTLKNALEQGNLADAKRMINELAEAPKGLKEFVAELFGLKPTDIKVQEPMRRVRNPSGNTAASPEVVVIGIDAGGYPERVRSRDSGHAIKLSTPEGHDWKLTQVQVYASRYGKDDPKGVVRVYICDSSGETSKDFAFPYGAFHMGEPGWVNLTLPEPVHVTDPFFVDVMTQSTKEAGIYVHHDGQRVAVESYETSRGKYKPFGQGNWKIRARLERRDTPAKNQDTSQNTIRPGDQVIVRLKAKEPSTYNTLTIYTVDDRGTITLDSRLGSSKIEVAGLDESQSTEAVRKSLEHPESWEEVHVERAANVR